MFDHLNYLVSYCFQSFILGIIQGFTEFLPISSTAHLKIVPFLIGWDDPGISISASLQLGSVIAIIFYFREQLSLIISSYFSILIHRKLFNDDNSTLAIYIFIASLPILICGLIIKLFWSDYSNSNLRGFLSIAIISIIMAILLAISEIFGQQNKKFKDIKIKDIIFLGISQSLAILPGVSRSGITLTSALFSGIERSTAARLSFLIGIPAIAISGLVELFSLLKTSDLLDLLPIIVGILSAFISSLIAIDFLLRFLVQNNTFVFVYYRLAFGIFILSIL